MQFTAVAETIGFAPAEATESGAAAVRTSSARATGRTGSRAGPATTGCAPDTTTEHTTMSICGAGNDQAVIHAGDTAVSCESLETLP